MKLWHRENTPSPTAKPLLPEIGNASVCAYTVKDKSVSGDGQKVQQSLHCMTPPSPAWQDNTHVWISTSK